MEPFSLNLPSVSTRLASGWITVANRSMAPHMDQCKVCPVRTPAEGRDVFVHVFDWPAAALELTAENLPKFRSASLLATGQSLEFHQGGPASHAEAACSGARSRCECHRDEGC
jgi:hypothetical protein